FDRPDQALQRIVPTERVTMPFRQFLDVVSGRPDLDPGPRPQDHGAHALLDEGLQRLDDLVDQRGRERVALLEMVEADRADMALDPRFDERHGVPPTDLPQSDAETVTRASARTPSSSAEPYGEGGPKAKEASA